VGVVRAGMPAAGIAAGREDREPGGSSRSGVRWRPRKMGGVRVYESHIRREAFGPVEAKEPTRE